MKDQQALFLCIPDRITVPNLRGQYEQEHWTEKDDKSNCSFAEFDYLHVILFIFSYFNQDAEKAVQGSLVMYRFGESAQIN